VKENFHHSHSSNFLATNLFTMSMIDNRECNSDNIMITFFIFPPNDEVRIKLAASEHEGNTTPCIPLQAHRTSGKLQKIYNR
jgi:hypothetical protein